MRGNPLLVKTLCNHAHWRKHSMKIWSKPAVREQEVGLEVTSYLPAEIDVI
jgi:coenzyme PQQ precursor peptide PqqA